VDSYLLKDGESGTGGGSGGEGSPTTVRRATCLGGAAAESHRARARDVRGNGVGGEQGKGRGQRESAAGGKEGGSPESRCTIAAVEEEGGELGDGLTAGMLPKRMSWRRLVEKFRATALPLDAAQAEEALGGADSDKRTVAGCCRCVGVIAVQPLFFRNLNKSRQRAV
jgi:hypothetical protein